MDSATLATRCKNCQELSKAVNQEPFDRGFSHYKTFKELEASAAAGCPLCQLLRRVLLFSARDIKELYLGTQVDVTPLGSDTPRPKNLWVVLGDSGDGSFGEIIYPAKFSSIEPIRRKFEYLRTRVDH